MFKKRHEKNQIIAAGRRLDAKGLVAGTGGNLSVRMGNRILITASGKCKGTLRRDDITETDIGGRVLSGMMPARDILMHVAVYKLRPEVRAIAHMHPPVVTGFAITDHAFDEVFLPEVLFELDGIAVADFAVPTSPDVPKVVEKALRESPGAKAVVLAGHGALTMSEEGVMDACYKMELLEMAARSMWTARLLGSAKPLTEQQLSSIKSGLADLDIRRR